MPAQRHAVVSHITSLWSWTDGLEKWRRPDGDTQYFCLRRKHSYITYIFNSVGWMNPNNGTEMSETQWFYEALQAELNGRNRLGMVEKWLDVKIKVSKADTLKIRQILNGHCWFVCKYVLFTACCQDKTLAKGVTWRKCDALVLLWQCAEKWCFWKWTEPFRDTTNLFALFVVVCWQTRRQLFSSLIAGCYQGERLERRRSLSHSGWNRCILISSHNTTATKM